MHADQLVPAVFAAVAVLCLLIVADGRCNRPAARSQEVERSRAAGASTAKAFTEGYFRRPKAEPGEAATRQPGSERPRRAVTPAATERFLPHRRDPDRAGAAGDANLPGDVGEAVDAILPAVVAAVAVLCLLIAGRADGHDEYVPAAAGSKEVEPQQGCCETSTAKAF
ncbi:hypothetical protein ZWY2020_051788 [Hordeum vulgare]|nr:hypothetical protein ZWY2020_051788 [Hordeum vulgare]